MPIYEYQCQKCKAHLEILQKMSDKPLSKCSKCGGKLEKQWSNTSFQLKGSGWYVTDYAAKKGDSGGEKKSPVSEDSTTNGGPSSNGKEGMKEKDGTKETVKSTADSNSTDKKKTPGKTPAKTKSGD